LRIKFEQVNEQVYVEPVQEKKKKQTKKKKE
jgi:hypothetical protein